MSEQIIRDMLREEKKRDNTRDNRDSRGNREVSKKDRGHSRTEIEQIREKEKRKREKERKRREEAREAREVREPRTTSSTPVSHTTAPTSIPEATVGDGKQKFMFVFEDTDGMLYSSLSSIIKDEGKKVKIFPVYIAGHTENTSEEEIEYRDGKYVPHEDNLESSWLQILEKVPEGGEIVTCDVDDIVVFNNLFYYTIDDFYHYLENSGADYLPVKHAI